MKLEGGYETSIDPKQFSDHMVPVLRAMGFLNGHQHANVKIIGIEGLIPLKVTYAPIEEEEPKERMVLTEI